MPVICQVTIDGRMIEARQGDLLLDAALKASVDLPFQCRSGHCGTCRVQVVSGKVQGGESGQDGIVHACQCRIAGDAVIAKQTVQDVRKVRGTLSIVRTLSPDIVEIGIKTDGALPHHPGQYAIVQFAGYPARSFSITHPISNLQDRGLLWFHVQRAAQGRVTCALGEVIKPGHRVTLTGPYGSAFFRPQHKGRMILVGMSTGFAPVWAIAAAALRENPYRTMMVIAGGRTMQSLYMAPALVQLSQFPNVHVVPVCSGKHALPAPVRPGRPTDHLPRLQPSDLLYACGAPPMVDAVRARAAEAGAICHADPFLPSGVSNVPEALVPTRKVVWARKPFRGRKTDTVQVHHFEPQRA